MSEIQLRRSFILILVLFAYTHNQAYADPEKVVVIPMGADAAITGYEVVSESSANNSNAIKTVDVECPAGKVIVGGGAGIYGAFSGVAITHSGILIGSPTKWRGTGQEIVSNASSWSLRVDVICIDNPN